MTIRLALPILDLTERPSARTRDLRTGASVWYREDVRLADGASRIVPAVFQGYDRRRRSCAITRGRTDDGSPRREWVALEDVVARYWADEVDDLSPRLAWIPLGPTTPDERSADLFLVVAAAAVAVAGLVALWRIWA